MHKEFILYCDESSSKEKHFSDFYGGALIGSSDIDFIRSKIAAKKAELNLFGELKWTKITENYQEKYIQIIDCVFDMIKDGKIKIRIMFTQNIFAAKNLRKEALDNKYFVLYYQFIKHAFGLKYATSIKQPVNLRIYLDKMPDTKIKVDIFKKYLVNLACSAEYHNSGILIDYDNITEVVSHEHDILQCLDIILGSINFRLNDKYKEIPTGKHKRGKRTVAKDKVYKHINKIIRDLYPRFNVGISTGTGIDIENRWHHPYRHWCFIPNDREIVGVGKNKK